MLTGRIIGSADQSERFLWDLRRLVAERVATDYVGGLRDECHGRGLGLWLENYGHWGFPGEFLKYGSESDRIGGEFWMPGGPWDTLGQIGLTECRAASSCANTYGKFPIVSAEAFTGGPIYRSSPATLKARGDWAFCQGVNHFVLHVYMHQPWADKVPGLNVWFGTEFNRNNTWFEQSKAWIDYLRRSSWLLQQGSRVADVAYFIGEDAPKMTGTRKPALPPGRDFDFINAEVIEKNLSVKNGLLMLPHGVNYRVLVLPEQTTMRPAVLRKIRDLMKAGATLVGPPPSRSPSLENFPKSDAEVRKLAREVWGELVVSALAGRAAAPPEGGTPNGEHKFGKGRVIWGTSLEEIFASAGVPADIEFHGAADANFLFTHRATKTTDSYFVSNQKGSAEKADCVFRVAGRQPELWDAVTGEHRALPDWSVKDGRTVVPLEFAPSQSWFVVFQKPATPPAQREPNFPEAKTIATLAGPWEVSFAPGWGAPDNVTFDQLTDWTQRAEDGIKHFSGAATYRKTFELPDSKAETKNSKLILDLGAAHDLATVRVNGKELATLWTAPWRVDFTSAVKSGVNTLEITVVNPWNNRLVGDAALPASERRTFLTSMTVKSDVPLLPAGLLGPVT
ncbi:MAG: glycosyl hydrolase, partial [Verrucomicrobia bacterium]|nr:glycosyl hydrolase [Verrucomicrobiota bacterium]